MYTAKHTASCNQCFTVVKHNSLQQRMPVQGLYTLILLVYMICVNMSHYSHQHCPIYIIIVHYYKQMLQYSIETFFPEAAAVAAEQGGLSSDSGLQAGTAVMYEEVVKRTAELVASWQCVG
jgi:Protein adenylyltransferase SelO